MSAAAAYRYAAHDRTGARCRGTIRASNEVDAFRQLSASGLTPVKIRRQREHTGRSRRGVSQRQVAHFTYQLSVLISARVPIGEGLRSIAEQEPPGTFRSIVLNIAGRIDAGGRISEAMAEHREAFGDLYVQTIRAAEETGNMIRVLEYLSEMLERQIELRQQIRGALAYPVCVIAVLAVAVTLLVGFVVPKFAAMFAQRGIELPIFTRLLMVVGGSMQAYWYVYLAAGVIAALGVRWAWRTPAPRAAIERALHRIPILQQILVGLAMARFATVLGLCLKSGLGLMDALVLSGRAAGRPMLAADARTMVDQVRSGGRIADILASCRYIPPFARRMLASGEESGELVRMCEVVSRHYQRDAASLTRNLATVIEPVLIVLIAAVVLAVALAIFLPMWNMVALMS